MPEIICSNCGKKTNTAVCKWYPYRADNKAHYCYAVFENGKWIKGCCYDKADEVSKTIIDEMIV